jgi:DNA-binding MarR family transcriptional regulator
MPDIDPVIHQPVRLRIMAALDTLGPKDQLDFRYLKDLLAVTDGNLGSHLQRLEEAGYIEVHKTFVGRRPRTFVSATSRGRYALQEHVQALHEILAEAGAGAG